MRLEKQELKVPEGFYLEVDEVAIGHDLLQLPNVGYASIDWNKRCYRAGITTTSQRMTNREYKGMGWRQRLLDDAAEWLSKIAQKRPA